MRPQKRERRAYYRNLAESFPASLFDQWNQALGPRLVEAASAIAKGSTVAVYHARPKEASLQGLLHQPLRFCFPRVLDADRGAMEFRWVEMADGDSEFVAGPFGILEPSPRHPLVTREEMAACFVPLLAFDAEGRRLGRGRGFYDRFLHGFHGLKIGVGFEWQLSPETLPVENHDQRLDVVVTEQAVRNFNRPRI